jgi:hypothetical protein
MIYVAQEPSIHRPPSLFWTGTYWSATANRKEYKTVEEAATEARIAFKSAARAVLVVDGDTVVLKLKPRGGV